MIDSHWMLLWLRTKMIADMCDIALEKARQ
jgi:hypothetical protein